MPSARRAASTVRSVVLALPSAWLLACASTGTTAVTDPAREGPASAREAGAKGRDGRTPDAAAAKPPSTNPASEERRIAVALVRMGEAMATPEERRFLARILGAGPAGPDAEALEGRMRTMLATSFSNDERLLALAQGQLHFAFELLRAGAFADARLIARFVLAKEGLSPQLQRWALSAWMVSHALELDARATASTAGAALPTDFNGLQRAHCEEICALPGWRLVSVEDGGSLSQEGYFDRLLTRMQFELAGTTRPPWLTRLLERARAPEGPPAPKDTARAERGEPPLAALARLTTARRFVEAAELGVRALAERDDFLARKGTRALAAALSGPCDGLRVHTAYARANLARSTQRREEFLARQEELVAELEKPRCDASFLALEEEDYGAFVTDARLWYARLLWEGGRLPEAEKWASRAAASAARAGDWDLYLEAAQTLVGRIEFERREPSALVSVIDDVIARYGGPEEDAFTSWSLLRKGLAQLAAGRGQEAEATFVRLGAVAEGASARAQAAYWTGRARLSQGLYGDAEEAMSRAGREDPLGYYDVLAGRAIARVSGFASTASASPFDGSWREVQERWIRMRVGRPFVLFRPELWFGDDSGDDEEETTRGPDRVDEQGNGRGNDGAGEGAESGDASSARTAATPGGGAGLKPGTDATSRGPDSPDDAPKPGAVARDAAARARRKAFEGGVASSLLLATALRAGLGFETFERFSASLRDSGTLFTRLLRSEALWLQQTYVASYGGGRRHLPSAVRIAWLLHALGDSRNAIAFVALFKDDLLRQEEDLAFLYFIFFPKPFAPSFQEAARECGVDPDLLYAVARQESLFQPAVISGAGAVGLMQLLPATATRVLAARSAAASGVSGAEGASGVPRKATRETLTDPGLNTLAGACYLRELLDRYKGDVVPAVAAYNAGEAMVDAWLRTRAKSGDPATFVEWIPFQETRDYVQKVLRNHANFRWIYGGPGA